MTETTFYVWTQGVNTGLTKKWYARRARCQCTFDISGCRSFRLGCVGGVVVQVNDVVGNEVTDAGAGVIAVFDVLDAIVELLL